MELLDSRALSTWEEVDANKTTCTLRALGKRTKCMLSKVEKHHAHQYVLLNDDKMNPFLLEYMEWEKLQRGMYMGFLKWLKKRVDGLIVTRP